MLVFKVVFPIAHSSLKGGGEFRMIVTLMPVTTV